MDRWDPRRQPHRGSCPECQIRADSQCLPGHDDCLPPINGLRTANGVEIVEGLRVWDYDLKPGTVIEVARFNSGTPDSPLGIVAWHYIRCDDGSFASQDGSRLCTIHPFTGQQPPVLESGTDTIPG